MRLTAFLTLLLSACNMDKGKSTTADDTAGSGDTAGTDTSGDSGGDGHAEDTGEATIPAVVLSAEVTWTLTFDAEAEASGFTDCTYGRSYEGAQVLDLDFLCPACSFLTVGTATMTGGADCVASVFGEEEAGDRTESWGVSDDLTLYRTGTAQLSLGDLTTFAAPAAEGDDIPIAWSSDYTMSAGGTMTLSAAGTMRYHVDDTVLLQDPWPARTEPYACGWPRNDPGTLEFDYDLAAGSTFPNVRLVDQCDEKLSLWDLYGSYLVIDTSQPDCGPCRSMASTSEAFLADMNSAGIPVHVVSLLGAGLADPWDTPDAATFNTWVDTYSLTDPVLYDRGFGYALFPDFALAFTGEDFGYPTWIVVDPEMKIIYANVGFSTWDPVASVIQADWDAR